MLKKYLSLIFLALIVSGCVSYNVPPQPPQYAKISLISVTFHVDYNALSNTNWTYAKENLSKMNFIVLVYTDPEYEPKNTDFGLDTITNRTDVSLAISVFGLTLSNGTKSAVFDISYRPVNTTTMDDDNELQTIKGFIKDKSDQVAQVCNSTLNWSIVKWTINYAD